MDDYLYLISSVVFVASSSILGAFYNKKTEGKEGAPALYTFLLMCSVFAFWLVVFLTDLQVDINVVWYALLFAASYTICNVGLINALKTGSVVLTSLLLQLSMIGITIWSFLFWDVAVTSLVIFGLVLVVIALWLCLWTGKETQGEFNPKWILYVMMAFVGNAGCGIIQRTQQMQFNGEYGGFLMLVAMVISLVISLVTFLQSQRVTDKETIIKSCIFPVAAGICNGLLNLFIIILATSSLSPSLIYPVLSIGGLMLTSIFSVFVFKEKMRWWQWVGVVIGIVAVGVLSV